VTNSTCPAPGCEKTPTGGYLRCAKHHWRMRKYGSYDLANGPIPDGAEIDHMCHVRNCVNPAHLRTATHKQNQEHLLPQRNNTSGFRGVHWDKRTAKWRVVVGHNNASYDGGQYSELEVAAEVARESRDRECAH